MVAKKTSTPDPVLPPVETSSFPKDLLSQFETQCALLEALERVTGLAAIASGDARAIHILMEPIVDRFYELLEEMDGRKAGAR